MVTQLRFTRSEWQRALDGLTDAEARRRLELMNCISWLIGHLAWQEQLYWLKRSRAQLLVSELDGLVGYGRPASTPPLAEMWQAWQAIIQAADPYLDTLTTESLQSRMLVEGQPFHYNLGTMLQGLFTTIGIISGRRWRSAKC